MAFEFDDDKKMEQITAFLEKARKDGIVSDYEIDELMTECDLDQSNRETIVETLESSGVEITGTESVNDFDDIALAEIDDTEDQEDFEDIVKDVEDDNFEDIEKTMATDDPVRMYLKEIGKVPLLPA